MTAPARRLITAALLVGACGSNGPHGASAVDAPASQGDAPVTGDGAVGARDPALPGDLVETHHDASIPGKTSGRTLPATIYVPTGGPTPRPLVVISPGFQMARTQYASYAEHLATWGFTVVLTDYADTGFFADHQQLADDISAVLDWSLAQPDLAVDAAKLAVAGHSLGGDLSVLAASGDARIKAVVGWDPVDASNPSVVPEKMATMTAALAVVGETTDATGGFMPCAPAGDNFEAFYAATTGTALQLTLAGADHMDWVDDPSCSVCSFCTAGTASPDLARTTSRRLDVAWLRRTLLGDTAMDPWLAAPPEVAAGTATVQRK